MSLQCPIIISILKTFVLHITQVLFSMVSSTHLKPKLYFYTKWKNSCNKTICCGNQGNNTGHTLHIQSMYIWFKGIKILTMCNNKALLLLVGNIQQIGVNQIFLLVFAIFPSWALFLRVSPVKHFLRDSAVLVHRSNRLRKRITT